MKNKKGLYQKKLIDMIYQVDNTDFKKDIFKESYDSMGNSESKFIEEQGEGGVSKYIRQNYNFSLIFKKPMDGGTLISALDQEYTGLSVWVQLEIIKPIIDVPYKLEYIQNKSDLSIRILNIMDNYESFINNTEELKSNNVLTPYNKELTLLNGNNLVYNNRYVSKSDKGVYLVVFNQLKYGTVIYRYLNYNSVLVNCLIHYIAIEPITFTHGITNVGCDYMFFCDINLIEKCNNLAYADFINNSIQFIRKEDNPKNIIPINRIDLLSHKGKLVLDYIEGLSLFYVITYNDLFNKLISIKSDSPVTLKIPYPKSDASVFNLLRSIFLVRDLLLLIKLIKDRVDKRVNEGPEK